MAFTDQEKDRILWFLGYPDWVSLAQSMQLGYPAASQPAFLVFDAFNRMTPAAENTIRGALCNLEDIDCQLSSARGRLKAKSLGELELNPGEISALRNERTNWIRLLADALGVVPNPFSQANYYGMSGGIGAKVQT